MSDAIDSASPALFDAHCHYHHPPVATFWADIAPTLHDLGLAGAVVNGTAPDDWNAIARFAADHAWVTPAFGVHPRMVGKVDRSDVDDWVDQLRLRLDADPRAVIGEVGLDHSRNQPPSARQKAVFLAQLDEAIERDLPLCIHGVHAWVDVLGLLKHHGSPARGFLCHAYTSSPEMAEQFAELGAMFSFNARTSTQAKLREVIKSLPAERVLLESDAPYMPPLPDATRYRFDLPREHGGQRRAHPANLQVAYETVAKLRKTPLAQLAEQVEQNYRRLFG